MDFKEFKELWQANFKEISMGVDMLFEVEVDKDELWNIYLDSFPEGTNELLRERREFDCSACKHFIRAFGNIVVIKNNEVISIWDFPIDDPKYQPVLIELSEFIHSKPVTNVFLAETNKIGTDKNLEKTDDGFVNTWEHFFLYLPDKFVNKSGLTTATVKGNYKATRDVFNRSLKEISTDSIQTVLELIYQNSLYKGQEWESPLAKFHEYKEGYILSGNPELYAWEKSIEAGPVVGKIRNHSIGTLLVNISDGMDLNLAVKKYEEIVAPLNYKRPKPVYTQRMLNKAKETVTELGFMDSLGRRFATLDDITVNNILFSNRDSAKRIQGVFEEMGAEVAIDPKHFSKVEEVPIKEFIENILPTAQELELFLENKHTPNMVSLIAPKNKTAPTMFKWDNRYSWAYAGNITDSSMKERVKSLGGNVTGELRFSIQWNDIGPDNNDLDAHCIEPNGFEIYFQHMKDFRTSGELDVDITNPQPSQVAVENITWSDKSKMAEGVYKLFVKNYTYRGGKSGFRAEIEFNGQIYSFEYNAALKQGEKVQVAEVTYSRANGFSIKEMIPSTVATRDVWNVKTNQFIPVSVVMYSPNYWDEQVGIGNRHFMFMLKSCVNPEKPNGFYNEFLKHDLLEHKKVFEALGSKMAVEDVEDQLSGVGFSVTQRNDVLVKVKGQTDRIIKIKV